MTDDPIRDAAHYYEKLEEEEAKLPVCSCCNYPIVEDNCYEVDGYLYCPDCMETEFGRNTEDYIED